MILNWNDSEFIQTFTNMLSLKFSSSHNCNHPFILHFNSLWSFKYSFPPWKCSKIPLNMKREEGQYKIVTSPNYRIITKNWSAASILHQLHKQKWTKFGKAEIYSQLLSWKGQNHLVSIICFQMSAWKTWKFSNLD